MISKAINMDRAKSVVLLTAALVMTATWAVSATGWTKGINIVSFIGLGVILIGLMLARSILPGLIAHLFSLIIGLGWSFWVTSRLLPPHYTWLERWNIMVFRLHYWYEQALIGGTNYDNLMFILQMSVIIWTMGYLTIWFIFRLGKVWQAIIPGGLVLLINLYYAPEDITFWFLVYLMLSLLLITRFNLFEQETKWRAEGVLFRPDISFDFLRHSFIFSILLVGLAWLAPPLIDAKSLGVLNGFEGSWRELQGEWNRLYADLNYRPVYTVDTFGQSLELGGPRRLTREPVMDVGVEGIGRYWRAAVYDEYTGSGWRSNDTQSTSFEPEMSPLSLPIFAARIPVTQTYTFYRNRVRVLYGMSHPLYLDRPVKVNYYPLSEEQVAQTALPAWSGSQEPWAEEITFIQSKTTMGRGESYQVVSAASVATVNQLRESNREEYPAWITARYLQLPDTITGRTRELAQSLTKPYDNPLDKAQAIEKYLRTEIKYNESLSTPPADRDKVDYILFTAKEAYCDYYASAMIVMLRSIGIPARLAVGFSQGSYNSEQDTFYVVQADAHSWVEVYFNQYGWIEFEPTAAQSVIIRPTEAEEDASFASSSIPTENLPGLDERLDRPGNIPIDENISLPFTLGIPWLGTTISIPRAMLGSGAVLAGITLLAAMAVGGGLWGWQLVHTRNDILKLYQQMVRLAAWMGITMYPWQTPYEHAALLQRRLPGSQHEVDLITREYVYQTFASITDQKERQTSLSKESSLAWRHLRLEMIKAALNQSWPQWLRGKGK